MRMDEPAFARSEVSDIRHSLESNIQRTLASRLGRASQEFSDFQIGKYYLFNNKKKHKSIYTRIVNLHMHKYTYEDIDISFVIKTSEYLKRYINFFKLMKLDYKKFSSNV